MTLHLVDLSFHEYKRYTNMKACVLKLHRKNCTTGVLCGLYPSLVMGKVLISSFERYDLQVSTFEDSRVMLVGMSHIKFERIQILMVCRI